MCKHLYNFFLQTDTRKVQMVDLDQSIHGTRGLFELEIVGEIDLRKCQQSK